MNTKPGKGWRGGKSKTFAVTACNATARRLQADYLSILNWGTVGAKYGVSAGMAYRVANGYEPKTAKVRAALGLPVLLPAAACPVHGVVHTAKRCPKAAPLAYDAWRTAHLPTLLRMCAWCETPKEQRGAWER